MDFIHTSHQLIAGLFILSILPLLVVMGTAFLKLALIFSLLRNALGIQQIPPNIAIYGLALVLTLFIMAPVGIETYEKAEQQGILINSDQPLSIDRLTQISTPYRTFLQKHTAAEQIIFFAERAQRHWPEKYRQQFGRDSLLILMPAFTVSQLIDAFKIGVLIYLPFIAIDLIVSNILLAMGMMMVSPITISLPFKLLIFLLAGGWQLLLDQLMSAYT